MNLGIKTHIQYYAATVLLLSDGHVWLIVADCSAVCNKHKCSMIGRVALIIAVLYWSRHCLFNLWVSSYTAVVAQ
jgi:hypothetical protein